MSRRRPTFAAYLRRRWRAVGAVVVLLLGSLLVVGVTDRGHDPAWARVSEEIEQAAVSPDGSVTYALLRREGGGNITTLQARRGDDGELLWEGPLNATRALMAAGNVSVAVATDFPRAFLTLYNADGSARWQVALEGNPTALRVEGERVALALNAPGNPILVFQGDFLIRKLRHPSPVRALDLERGLVAAGGLDGEIVVHRERVEVLNVTLDMSVRSLRMAEDGTALVVGGSSRTPSDPEGRVAYLDLLGGPPVRWERVTPVAVGLVDLDTYGLLAMAVEDEPPRSALHVYEGSTGATLWTRRLPGTVARADSGTWGGAAISPDGATVAVATLRDDIVLLDARDGNERWTYRAGGAGVVTYPEGEPDRLLVAARVLENRPYDSLLLFSLDGEPVPQRAALQTAILFGLATLSLALIVGVGFWRARRPY